MQYTNSFLKQKPHSRYLKLLGLKGAMHLRLSGIPYDCKSATCWCFDPHSYSSPSLEKYVTSEDDKIWIAPANEILD